MAGLPRAYVRLEEVPPNRARRGGRSSEVTGSTVVICLGPSPESDIGKCFKSTHKCIVVMSQQALLDKVMLSVEYPIKY